MDDVVQTLTQDLRLALLVIGGALLLVIVLWEVLQRRRAARADAVHLRGPLGKDRDASSEELDNDPLLGSSGRSASGAVSGAVSGRPLAPEEGSREDERLEPTLDLPEINVRDRLVEPRLVDLDIAMSAGDRGASIPVVSSMEREPFRASPETPPESDREPDQASAVEPTPDTDSFVEPAAAAPAARAEPVIIALRVVAREGERFTGAALRQALQGEGFVHGDLDIFHRAAADGRPLMSAASLTKPGSFDLATMDSARFLGVNLFAVLPGPLPGRDAVDKLLLVGHTLAQRLRGNLLDSKGQALTETRLAEMRREAAAAGGR